MTKPGKYSWFLVAFVSCLVVAASCTQERQPCLTPTIASLIVQTKHLATDTSTVFTDTALPAAVFLALTDSGANGGYYSPVSSFKLSLSSVSDTCRWAMATDTVAGAPYDTITFFYQRQLQFISNACGYMYFYNIDSVRTTHYNIDSLHISNRSVSNNVNTNHLQVYIHPVF